MPKSRPLLKLSPRIVVILPTSAGPLPQPKSPKSANRANIAVPPVGIFSQASEKVPGHITPTDKPQRPHASSDINGTGDKPATI